MTAPEGTHATSPRPDWWWPVLFAVVLLLHGALVTRRWTAGELRGHEFRQAQTAISAQFIQVENNFSLAYPTPLLGKPWAVPMEFPLYQWSTVWVSNALGLPLAEAGRTVAWACFILTLPGLFVLLGQMRLAHGARWLALTLAVSCPLYIFYSRAVLIESMALMFAAWYLAAFVGAMRSRRVGWFVLATLAGVGAALVKVTTLMIWMAPAAAYGFHLLWRSREGGGKAVARTAIRGALLAAGPCLAAVWWVRKADAIKALNPSGQFLMSESMRWFNFGTWPERFQVATWSDIFRNWNMGLMPLWLAAVALASVLALPAAGRRIGLWAAAATAAALFTFPRLFALHDYYFYSVGLFWLGMVAVGLHTWSQRFPRWMTLVLVTVVVGVQLGTYRSSYYGLQVTSGNGGNGLTDALRDLTSRDSVLIVAGSDWAGMIPYYAKRRALMLRTSTEYDSVYLPKALAQLAKGEVAALVVSGSQRRNVELIARVVQAYDLHPEIAFSHLETDVYLSRERRDWTVDRLHVARVYGNVVPHGTRRAGVGLPAMDRQVKTVSPTGDRDLFGHMVPMPVRYHFAFDANLGEIEGRRIVTAHPDAEIWFAPPAGMKEIAVAFGLLPGAYEREGDKTDGVEFIVVEQRPDGTEREVFRRKLEPTSQPGDRGLQSAVISCRPAAAAELVFKTRPVGNYAFDWAYWGPVTLR